MHDNIATRDPSIFSSSNMNVEWFYSIHCWEPIIMNLSRPHLFGMIGFLSFIRMILEAKR